jgi:hypothetical protein
VEVGDQGFPDSSRLVFGDFQARAPLFVPKIDKVQVALAAPNAGLVSVPVLLDVFS